MKKKMLIEIKADWVKAAVIAVPIKGAEQGVAIKVAKKPLKKSFIYGLFWFLERYGRLINLGILKLNWLNILIIKKKIIEIIINKK